MVVPVTLVARVPVSIVDVVGVITCGTPRWPAAFAVRMLVPGMNLMRAARALVDVVAVYSVHGRVGA